MIKTHCNNLIIILWQQISILTQQHLVIKSLFKIILFYIHQFAGATKKITQLLFALKLPPILLKYYLPWASYSCSMVCPPFRHWSDCPHRNTAAVCQSPSIISTLCQKLLCMAYVFSIYKMQQYLTWFVKHFNNGITLYIPFFCSWRLSIR